MGRGLWANCRGDGDELIDGDESDRKKRTEQFEGRIRWARMREGGMREGWRGVGSR